MEGLKSMNYMEAVRKDGLALQFVEKQTLEICMEAVKQNGWALEYVEEQTPEICMEAVKQNGQALLYVKEQTPEICMEAVKQNGLALQDVKKQTPEICMEAVKQNEWALTYVEEQTSEICMEAVKQNGLALKRVEEQTEEICLMAVHQNGLALQFVENQTPEICMAAVRQDRDAWHFVNEKIEQIMKKLDAFAKTADDYEMFADKDFQEELYWTLQEYKKLLKDNPDGIVTLQAKFYEQSNPNEMDIIHPDLWNKFWNYLERYGVTGDERFSNRLNNIATRPETKEQAFSIMKDIKEYLDNRLYMTSYMRGDVAVNEDIASYYLENAYRYLNQEFDNPDRNQEMENQIKAVQEVFSLDEAATGRFYTTNLGGTGWGMGETPYFYITEDLQSSFEAAYASYMASDENGKTIGYSNAGMSTAQIVILAGCYYHEGKEVHVLNKHLENQVFDEDSKVLADIEKRLYEELKQRNVETMAVQTEDFNSEVSNPAPVASQPERIQVAIESTADYVDPEKDKENRQKTEEKYEADKIEDYFKKREELEEQKKRERHQKEEQKAEDDKKKEEKQNKTIRRSVTRPVITEMLLLQEIVDLKEEISQVKSEISCLREELSSKKNNVEIVSKKDTKKKTSR